MASNRLTKDQVETIFRKGKVVSKFEPMKVSDCVEVLNHFVCIDFIINNVMEPLSSKLIKRLHYLLMFGSVDDRLDRVTPGKYRQQEHSIKGRSVISANQISSSLDSLIAEYEELQAKELVDILNFHVEFEMIAPFRDGNGRVGRLIMFKECLRHSIMPFIIDDKRRRDYLDGITKWSGRRKVFLEVAQETQTRFETQIDLHEYQKHGQNFLPDNYIE
jgi:Fic family protein